MDKQTFYDYCVSQITQVYELSQADTPDDKLKHRVEGVLHAGVLLGMLSKQEVDEIVDKTHLRVFGESKEVRRQRKAQRDKLETLKQDDPDTYYDTPAIERIQVMKLNLE